MRGVVRSIRFGWLAPLAMLVASSSLALLGGCTRCGSEPDAVQVFAASSLTESFEELERAFEAEHPGTDVSLSFAGSQVLRLQIEQGAEADVFVSANPRHMQALVDAGRVEASQIFARNELVVIVPLDNPAELESFSDLPRAERLVLGTEDVPVGSYARAALERAGDDLGSRFEQQVRDAVVSEETNVRLVRAKVELGEADAAIVYRTDAAASERVRAIEIPDAYQVKAEYPIGVVSGARQPELARRWIDFVLSERGQSILARHGFVPTAAANRP